jgi:hypothetical protein
MKKIGLLLLLITLLASPCRGIDDAMETEIKTKGYVNGRAIIQFMNGDDNGKYLATQFIAGVLEGMSSINGGMTIREIYPDFRREDVIRSVIEYYMKNPSKQYRPVVDVILSGCK